MKKYQDFSVVQIFREISFGESDFLKLPFLGALKIVNLVNFSHQKLKKSFQIKIQSLLVNVLKMADFALIESVKLISLEI